MLLTDKQSSIPYNVISLQHQQHSLLPKEGSDGVAWILCWSRIVVHARNRRARLSTYQKLLSKLGYKGSNILTVDLVEILNNTPFDEEYIIPSLDKYFESWKIYIIR